MSPTLSFADMYQNRLFIVGIGPIINRELEFVFDMIALIVREFIVRYQYYTINYIYKDVTQSAIMFVYKSVAQIVMLFL